MLTVTGTHSLTQSLDHFSGVCTHRWCSVNSHRLLQTVSSVSPLVPAVQAHAENLPSLVVPTTSFSGGGGVKHDYVVSSLYSL